MWIKTVPSGFGTASVQSVPTRFSAGRRHGGGDDPERLFAVRVVDGDEVEGVEAVAARRAVSDDVHVTIVTGTFTS